MSPSTRLSSLPRKRRFFLADVPARVVQRGNNRQAIFFADNDYRVYLGWIGAAAQRRSGAAVELCHSRLRLDDQSRAPADDTAGYTRQ